MELATQWLRGKGLFNLSNAWTEHASTTRTAPKGGMAGAVISNPSVDLTRRLLRNSLNTLPPQ
jgi:hypothetical protein